MKELFTADNCCIGYTLDWNLKLVNVMFCSVAAAEKCSIDIRILQASLFSQCFNIKLNSLSNALNSSDGDLRKSDLSFISMASLISTIKTIQKIDTKFFSTKNTNLALIEKVKKTAETNLLHLYLAIKYQQGSNLLDMNSSSSTTTTSTTTTSTKTSKKGGNRNNNNNDHADELDFEQDFKLIPSKPADAQAANGASNLFNKMKDKLMKDLDKMNISEEQMLKEWNESKTETQTQTTTVTKTNKKKIAGDKSKSDNANSADGDHKKVNLGKVGETSTTKSSTKITQKNKKEGGDNGNSNNNRNEEDEVDNNSENSENNKNKPKTQPTEQESEEISQKVTEKLEKQLHGMKLTNDQQSTIKELINQDKDLLKNIAQSDVEIPISMLDNLKTIPKEDAIKSLTKIIKPTLFTIKAKPVTVHECPKTTVEVSTDHEEFILNQFNNHGEVRSLIITSLGSQRSRKKVSPC